MLTLQIWRNKVSIQKIWTNLDVVNAMDEEVVFAVEAGVHMKRHPVTIIINIFCQNLQHCKSSHWAILESFWWQIFL